MKYIDVSTAKYPHSIAMVDDEDWEFLSAWKWYAKKSKVKIYAVRNRRISDPEYPKLIRMHRVIAQLGNYDIADHNDGNGLNNQKTNLRKCTVSENNRNLSKRINGTTSKYKGVTHPKGNKKFIAMIMKNREARYLGSFNSEEKAAEAYDAAAKELHGEFARLNF